jgi:hypothetical protein
MERSSWVEVGAQNQHKQQTCDATGKRRMGSYAINDRFCADHHTDSDAASFTQILSLAIVHGARVIFTRQEDLSHQSRLLAANSRCSTQIVSSKKVQFDDYRDSGDWSNYRKRL